MNLPYAPIENAILAFLLVLNGRFSGVDELDLFRHDVHGRDLVVLSKEHSQRQTDLAGTGDAVGLHKFFPYLVLESIESFCCCSHSVPLPFPERSAACR